MVVEHGIQAVACPRGERHPVGVDENRRTAFRNRGHLGDVGDIHRGTPVGLTVQAFLSSPVRHVRLDYHEWRVRVDGSGCITRYVTVAEPSWMRAPSSSRTGSVTGRPLTCVPFLLLRSSTVASPFATTMRAW